MVFLMTLRVISDLALAPALIPLAHQRRHFPLFVASVQLLAAVMYDLCLALGASRLFIRNMEWHFIADVLSLAYFLLMVVHLAVIENEDAATSLRYVAFFASWVFKYRDSWDSVGFEVGLGVAFVLVAVHSHVTEPRRRAQFRMNHMRRAVAAGGVGFLFFAGSQLAGRTAGLGPAGPSMLAATLHHSLLCAVHVTLGYACYELWQVLPAPGHRGAKKLDLGGGMHASQGSASFV